MATRRVSSETYQTRLDDGSVVTRNYHEVVDNNGNVIEKLHRDGPAEFLVDAMNGQIQLSKSYRSTL